MKKNACIAMLVTSSLFMFSCNNDKSSSDTVSSTETATVSSDTSGDKMMNSTDNTGTAMATDTMNRTDMKPVTDKDVVDFVQKAIPGGIMEVQMGNMAAGQAQSQRVKDYGAMLVKDHTDAGNKLKAMAASNSINIPADMTAEQKSHMDMLMGKKGMDFDKAYMDMMVKDHKKDIDDYKKASANLSEESYKAFATMTLPVLQKHLDSAQAIVKGLK